MIPGVSTEAGAVLTAVVPGERLWLRRAATDERVHLLAVVVVVAAVIAAITPGYLDGGNIRGILESASLTGIVAVSSTPVTLSGNFFSLSTQQSAIFGAVLFAALIGHGLPAVLAIPAVIAAVALTGAVQGVVVAAGLNSIIATLAAGSILLGAVAGITHTQTISMGSHSVSWLGTDQVLGMPAAVLVFVGVTILVSWLSDNTVIGRQTTLVGANRQTARLSGIRVGRVTLSAFVLASAGAAVAGILSASAIGYADTQFFATLTFDVIAAVLVGGTAIQGGSGSPLRSAFGAVLIAMVTNAMLLHQYSSGAQQALEGALVLVVIVLLQSSLWGRRR